MASRQNQGLQIALIFFVVSTILLSVVVYFTSTSAIENGDKVVKKDEELREVKKQRDSYSTLSNLLMAWIGEGEWSEEQWNTEYENLVGDSDAALSDIVGKAKQYKTYYDEDMFNFSADYTDPKGWRTLPGYLLTTIKSKNSLISNVNTQLAELRANFDARIAAAMKQVDEAEKSRDVALQEKAEADRQHQATEANIRSEQEATLASLNTARQQQQADYTTLTDEVNVRDDRIVRLDENVSRLAAKVDEYEEEEFEFADGKITRINPTLGLVWINLGTADNLPRNAVFGVYGQDDSTFNRDGVKGKIRIKRILDGHSAEAEIVDSSIENTLLVGDNIFTSTWKPGRTMKYAISGRVDFDGDGIATALDLKRLISLIEDNAGQVVASVNPETGELEGEVDALTNFLVIGDADPEDASVLKAIADSSGEMKKAANEAGVQTMFASELMDSFGYRDDSNIERLGAGTSSEFVPRRPPARPGNDGAF